MTKQRIALLEGSHKKISVIFFMINLCLISNIAYSIPKWISYQHVKLNKKERESFQTYLKAMYVQANEIPDNATVSLESFVIDEDQPDQQLDQRYIVEVFATWDTPRKRGIFTLQPQRHNDFICSYIYASSLRAAGISLPE